MSTWALVKKMSTLFGAAKFHGNPMERNVKSNIIIWIHTDLKHRGLVHDNRKHKSTPLPTDISAMLRRFFSVEYLVATMKTTRAALNFALSLGLMLDCNNRISELLDDTDVPVELRRARAKERDGKAFTWKRVELYAFRDDNEQCQVKLQARLTFTKLKNPHHMTSGPRQKIIPLRLLPLELAAEDTLRWLIVLGLMDGVFVQIHKWADLDSVPYSPEGIKINIKKEFLDIPVSLHSNHP